jgi:hypothetical protein
LEQLIWKSQNGYAHVAAYLQQLDVSKFNPKEPPTTTMARLNYLEADAVEIRMRATRRLDQYRHPRPACWRVENKPARKGQADER